MADQLINPSNSHASAVSLLQTGLSTAGLLELDFDIESWKDAAAVKASLRRYTKAKVL